VRVTLAERGVEKAEEQKAEVRKHFQSYMDRLVAARDCVLAKIDQVCREYRQREAEVEAAIVEVNKRIEETKLKYEHQKTSEISKMLEYIATDVNVEVKMIVDEIVGKIKKQPKLADFKKVEYAREVKAALKEIHKAYLELKDEENPSDTPRSREKSARHCRDCEEKSAQFYKSLFEEFKLLQAQMTDSSEEDPTPRKACISSNLLKRSPERVKK